MNGPTSLALKPARRVVSKAFDGGAAINALLMKRLNAEDFHRELAIAEGLLAFGLPQVDVQNICGLPHKVIAAAARKTAVVVPRAGRRPVGMGKVLATPASHLRMSIFLGLIDQMVPGLKASTQIVTGEILLAALRNTDRVCGPMSDRDVGVRYYLTAIHQLGSGEIYFRQCGCCPVQYIRTKDPVRANGTVMTGGECPFCQYLRGLKAKSRIKRVGGAAERTDDLDVSAPGPADFDAATLTTEVSEKSQSGALRELMQ